MSDEFSDIWPEGVLTEDEWERAWFDRKVIEGRYAEADRASFPSAFGGAS